MHKSLKDLTRQYAQKINAAKEDYQTNLQDLYQQFLREYECLKKTEGLVDGCDADDLTGSSATPNNGLSH